MDDFTNLPLRISRQTLARIDDYWHTNRLMSRAAAIRELVERALDQAEKAEKETQR